MKQNIEILKKTAWPQRLLETPKPPKQLYIEGTLPDIHAIWLTVVGARRHSEYGATVCRLLIAGLQHLPIVIVSGLATGIDSIALQTGLDARLPCVAIPGSGLSRAVLYPQQNRQLAQDIIDGGGCLLSEFEHTQNAELWTFPQRNRIMAGLSHAVLIIEATKKSGTLITAKLATDYNRDVFAVPGNIFSENSAGPHLLISLGATPITSAEDLRLALGFETTNTLFQQERKLELTSDEQRLYDVLFEPTSRHRLTEQLHFSQEKINTLISSLELQNIITETDGLLRRV